MILNKNFLENEKESVLLKRNYGFITDDINANLEITKRAKEWIKQFKIEQEELDGIKAKLAQPKESKPSRILLADAERTFCSKPYQEQLINVTFYLYQKYDDYQQNLTFIISFLLLFLEPEESVAIMERIHDDTKYLPCHFNAVSVGSKIDILLFIKLMEEKSISPELNSLIVSEGVPPDFVKKWFSGLCVHLLPFEALFEYFTHFMQSGFLTCLRFGFIAFRVLEPYVKESDGIQEIMSVLELRISAFGSEENFLRVTHEIVQSMSSDSDEFDFVKKLNLKNRRCDVFEKDIKEQLKKADDYARDNPTESIPSCHICKEGFQELYCNDCGVVLCEECHETPGDFPHYQSHDVEDYESSGDSEDEVSNPK